MKLTKYILISLIFGIIFGIIFNLQLPDIFPVINEYMLAPIGSLFIKLIKMLVVPIVFFSIALGAAGIGDIKKLGRIGGKSILFFLSTTAVAIVLAMTLSLIGKPGEVANVSTHDAAYEVETTTPSLVDTLLNIVPDNPIQAASEGNMLQIIFFAIIIGLGMSILGSRVKQIHSILEEANQLMMTIVGIVMYIAPFGAFALITSAIGALGVDALKAMGLYLLFVVVALFLHVIITYSFMLKFIGKMNPVHFYKEFFPVMVMAFSTSSSSASLPLAMKTAQERLGVSQPISSFVQPLGATINMDGTAIMQGVATIFIAQAYNIDLTFSQLMVVVLTAVLASIGTAGVPGVGIIMLAMVLEQVNLPVEGIALIIGIDRFTDMFRTAVNVSGDAICACIIESTEKKYQKNSIQESA